MKETVDSSVCFQDYTYDELLKIIGFIYTDTAEFADIHDAVNILPLSDPLQLIKLKHLCEVAIVPEIELENVCDLMQLAERFNAPLLKGGCMRFVIANFKSVIKEDGYLLLDDQLLAEINRVCFTFHNSTNNGSWFLS